MPSHFVTNENDGIHCLCQAGAGASNNDKQEVVLWDVMEVPASYKTGYPVLWFYYHNRLEEMRGHGIP